MTTDERSTGVSSQLATATRVHSDQSHPVTSPPFPVYSVIAIANRNKFQNFARFQYIAQLLTQWWCDQSLSLAGRLTIRLERVDIGGGTGSMFAAGGGTSALDGGGDDSMSLSSKTIGGSEEKRTWREVRRDCNPGLKFSIPGFGIVKFPIPGSRRDWRSIVETILKLPSGLRYLGRYFWTTSVYDRAMDLVLMCCKPYRNILATATTAQLLQIWRRPYEGKSTSDISKSL